MTLNRPQEIPEHYLSVRQFAAALKVTSQTVYKWIQKDWVQRVKDNRGHCWFDPAIIKRQEDGEPIREWEKPASGRPALRPPAPTKRYIDLIDTEEL